MKLISLLITGAGALGALGVGALAATAPSQAPAPATANAPPPPSSTPRVSSPSGPLRAGAAMSDITPPLTGLLPGDYGLRDHLFARVIVVDNGQSCAVLSALDQGGVSTAMVNDAATRISAAIGCPVSNILISATHTHSGSASNGGLGGGLSATQLADALIAAARTAKARLEPVRMGYGTASLDLNVNRDLFDDKGNWRQAPNANGASDKTLAVVEFIGADGVPVGVYMNYAMHPVDFYLTGVISADFPGEASRYIETTYGGKTVAIFAQGASGNQNPKISETPFIVSLRVQRGAIPQTAAPLPLPPATSRNYVNENVARFANPVPPADAPAYRAAVEREGQWVTAMGTMIAENTLNVMRYQIPATDSSARIWSGAENFTCPGRDRLDAADPVRENVNPGYRDGADVNLKVGLLRLGDISFVSVNGEVYSEISSRLKAASPLSKTMMVTLANGGANSGYIYSNAASANLTFQVISSRLKPNCAEDKIVAAGLKLIDESQSAGR